MEVISTSLDTGLPQIDVPWPKCTATFQTHCIFLHTLNVAAIYINVKVQLCEFVLRFLSRYLYLYWHGSLKQGNSDLSNTQQWWLFTGNTETIIKPERFASSCQTITTDCNITDLLSCQWVVNFEILYSEFKCTKSPTNTTTTARETRGVAAGSGSGLNY
jgi:hypothetical protein